MNFKIGDIVRIINTSTKVNVPEYWCMKTHQYILNKEHYTLLEHNAHKMDGSPYSYKAILFDGVNTVHLRTNINGELAPNDCGGEPWAMVAA
jgi:hypothetical protein